MNRRGLYAIERDALSVFGECCGVCERHALKAGLDSSAATPVAATTRSADSATLRIVYEGP